MLDTLLPASFIDEARLRTHLNREQGGEDNIEKLLTWACNRAIAWMETRTQRRLRARNYRTQVTTTANGVQATGITDIEVASTAALRVDDDALAAGLEVASRIESITDGNTLVLDKRTVAAIGDGDTLTFGSKPLTIDVDPDERRGIAWLPFSVSESGTAELWCPECPLRHENLWAANWLDEAGNETALDLTGLRVQESSGRILLYRDMAPVGAQVVRLECRAGYEKPTATDIGHPNDWEALSSIQLRVAEVLFMDDSLLRGRQTGMSVGGVSLSAVDLRMPADIEEALRPYWRLSA